MISFNESTKAVAVCANLSVKSRDEDLPVNNIWLKGITVGRSLHDEVALPLHEQLSRKEF